MKKLLFAMAIGAALAWAFDPDSGSRRRQFLRRKIEQRRPTRPDATPSPVVNSTGPVPNSDFADVGEPVSSLR